MVLLKQICLPVKAFLHRVQLAVCRPHSVALYMLQIPGKGLASIGAALAGAGAGTGVQLKNSAARHGTDVNVFNLQEVHTLHAGRPEVCKPYGGMCGFRPTTLLLCASSNTPSQGWSML